MSNLLDARCMCLWHGDPKKQRPACKVHGSESHSAGPALLEVVLSAPELEAAGKCLLAPPSGGISAMGRAA